MVDASSSSCQNLTHCHHAVCRQNAGASNKRLQQTHLRRPFSPIPRLAEEANRFAPARQVRRGLPLVGLRSRTAALCFSFPDRRGGLAPPPPPKRSSNIKFAAASRDLSRLWLPSTHGPAFWSMGERSFACRTNQDTV
ncbi:hypothetical protein B0T26DRAFT_698677 [Lasiosphaeria miniovina]|uniref:Uncharacterized protein n=1 Tax=Lasiosphaeria miniovina TaxID=1954250 RepID=A0AA40B6I8_9PEZI|nr:uncharacterized protein B0T26DRAFT_698677 [Lasiosphaeria miniovina]KAK0728605.1 hypothetical protein B0T26DRAFT_698677 [Lasiosphaeria miniovina]